MFDWFSNKKKKKKGAVTRDIPQHRCSVLGCPLNSNPNKITCKIKLLGNGGLNYYSLDEKDVVFNIEDGVWSNTEEVVFSFTNESHYSHVLIVGIPGKNYMCSKLTTEINTKAWETHSFGVAAITITQE